MIALPTFTLCSESVRKSGKNRQLQAKNRTENRSCLFEETAAAQANGCVSSDGFVHGRQGMIFDFPRLKIED